MTYRPNLPIAAASLNQAGVVKPDGTTITTAADGTASVVGVAVTALTDIGTAGGPALTDVTALNRSGTDYKVALSALSTLFSSPAPVTTISASGTFQALAFGPAGVKAYDVTLTGNCAFSLSGGASGQLQTIVLVIRGGAGGFAPTLPSGIKWPGGAVPTVDASAGSYNEFYLRTIDGGTTLSGNY